MKDLWCKNVCIYIKLNSWEAVVPAIFFPVAFGDRLLVAQLDALEDFERSSLLHLITHKHSK